MTTSEAVVTALNGRGRGAQSQRNVSFDGGTVGAVPRAIGEAATVEFDGGTAGAVPRAIGRGRAVRPRGQMSPAGHTPRNGLPMPRDMPAGSLLPLHFWA